MTEHALPILRSIPDLRGQIQIWRQEGVRIGFAPTMGALHAGHLSLVRLLKANHQRVIASVFVNPTQFAAHEDLSRYPRDEKGDAAKLASAGCDALFAPPAGAMYPQGFSSRVEVEGVSGDLEGVARPQMFGGVATVVTKLLLQAMPDTAAFGEKDYQQLLVVRRLVRDLDIPVAIVAGETVREADGLAMSSRNAYLSTEHRAIAPALHQALQGARAAILAGAPVQAALDGARAAILEAGFAAVDYVALRDGDNFAPVISFAAGASARLLAAAKLGETRLIDNIAV
jgi:pantoate--beta-alanine ligase